MNDGVVTALFQLFDGFPYAYGTNEGGCRWYPLSDELAQRHIDGSEMVGVYPMVYDPHGVHCGTDGFDKDHSYPEMQSDLWMCRWGAIDIDEGDDAIVLGQNAITVLSALGIVAWLEPSRSKGCHVWIFSEEWVQASVMRKALMAALQIIEAPYDAVYPKQDSLDGPPGNYMRIPYGGGRPEGRQVIWDDNGQIMEYYDFITEAERGRTPKSLLIDAASYYTPPTTQVPDLPPARDYSKEPLMKVDGTRLRGLAKQMFENGPVAYYRQEGAGKGRHGFLNRFARAMFESGYSDRDVTAWTKDLDSNLGTWWDDGPKFSGRKDCDRQIERLVTDARSRAV